MGSSVSSRTSAGSGRRDLNICDSCVPTGTCKLGVDDLRVAADGGVVGTFVVPESARGHVVAHGGWIAWVFDEALGLLPHGLEEWAVTTSLTVTYTRPVPVGATVTVRAWLDRSEGQRRFLRGELRLDGHDLALASAEGEWVVIRDVAAHYERAIAWGQSVLGQA